MRLLRPGLAAIFLLIPSFSHAIGPLATATLPPSGPYDDNTLAERAPQVATSGPVGTSLPISRTPTLAPTTLAPTINIPSNAPVGGLSYTKPAITDAISYYKIAPDNAITFGWNFTSLYVTPTSLTFQAICSANSYTYPVAVIPGSNTNLVWNPYAYQQSPNAIPFAQASYTLRVFDERGINALASPGRFDGNNAIVNFAMYSPAAYTPLASGWTCSGCSWAPSLMSTLSHPLLVALPITAALVLIGGAGVLNG